MAQRPACTRAAPLPPVRRAATNTGTIVTRITKETTTFTSGRCCPLRSWARIQMGTVFWAPAVNVVTMTSSKESANAATEPRISASAVVTSAILTDSPTADTTSGSLMVRLTQSSVNEVTGQDWILELFSANSGMMTIGMKRNSRTTTTQILSATRVQNPSTV